MSQSVQTKNNPAPLVSVTGDCFMKLMKNEGNNSFTCSVSNSRLLQTRTHTNSFHIHGDGASGGVGVGVVVGGGGGGQGRAEKRFSFFVIHAPFHHKTSRLQAAGNRYIYIYMYRKYITA